MILFSEEIWSQWFAVEVLLRKGGREGEEGRVREGGRKVDIWLSLAIQSKLSVLKFHYQMIKKGI